MRRAILSITCCVLAASSLAQTADERIQAIEQAVHPLLVIQGEPIPRVGLEERMEQLGVPAVSIAVISNGAIEWARAYGFADREKQIPATKETLFQAASISKPVTAIAALRLVQNGTLDLDTNVNEYLTSWQIPDNEFTAEHKVTLRALLNHTAGTTVWGFPGYERDAPVPSTVDILDGKGNTEAVRIWKTPGEVWRYSGGGYVVLQQLLADISRRSFPELMRTTVLRPLGMLNSTFAQPLPEAWRDRAASGYDAAGARLVGGWHVYPEMAAAGLWTTPTDLAKYVLEVQRADHGEGIILDNDAAMEMLSPGMNTQGLGPDISDDGRRFGHGGSNEGFRAEFTAYIEDGAGAVIMTNSDNGAQLVQELLITIAHEYGWEGIEPIEKTVIDLQQSEYEAYLGRYSVEQIGLTLDVTYEDGHLIARGPSFGTFNLFPESKTLFFVRENGAPVEFVFENGSVTGLVAQGLLAQRVE